ncbi:HAMP domain protein, partial [Vibrio parahaemolyticus AQ3810]
KP